MSRKQTSQSNKCNHTSKVLEWGYNLIDGNMIPYASLWGCTMCDVTSTEPFKSDVYERIDHTKCGGPFECFGCKAKGLQLSVGDAGRDIPDKAWNSELSAYREARANGMQPAGTTRAHVEEAYRASEALGKAYDADSMPKTKDINKNTVEVMKEVGMA